MWRLVSLLIINYAEINILILYLANKTHQRSPNSCGFQCFLFLVFLSPLFPRKQNHVSPSLLLSMADVMAKGSIWEYHKSPSSLFMLLECKNKQELSAKKTQLCSSAGCRHVYYKSWLLMHKNNAHCQCLNSCEIPLSTRGTRDRLCIIKYSAAQSITVILFNFGQLKFFADSKIC